MFFFFKSPTHKTLLYLRKVPKVFQITNVFRCHQNCAIPVLNQQFSCESFSHPMFTWYLNVVLKEMQNKADVSDCGFTKRGEKLNLFKLYFRGAWQLNLVMQYHLYQCMWMKPFSSCYTIIQHCNGIYKFNYWMFCILKALIVYIVLMCF